MLRRLWWTLSGTLTALTLSSCCAAPVTQRALPPGEPARSVSMEDVLVNRYRWIAYADALKKAGNFKENPVAKKKKKKKTKKPAKKKKKPVKKAPKSGGYF